MLELIDLETLLRVAHLLALAMGLGGALLLDLVSCRFFLHRRISPSSYAIVAFGSTVVAIALSALWITGIAFLVRYSMLEPAKLGNPKIWAKLSIVAVLTLNGAYIHCRVLPFLRRQIGRSLFRGTTAAQRSALLTTAAISCISWLFPVLLGALRSSYPGETFGESYLGFAVPYAVVLAAAVSTAQLAGRLLPRLPTRQIARARQQRERDDRREAGGIAEPAVYGPIAA